ncbi:helix-turn-helix transcriptional regulator [Chryseolinea sp. T2]|uniref:AraC family transcriptional regulator n=1 Tax=Chryseolinea sp. T2 TaxID=3129255 RepID=UPI0030775FF1
MKEPVPSIPALSAGSYTQHYFVNKNSLALKDQDVNIFDRRHLKSIIPAHRLDLYSIQLLTAGEGLYVLGSREHYVHKNMLVFTSPNIITSWAASVDTNEGFGCIFSDIFFTADRTNKQYLADLPFFQMGENQVLCLSDEQTADFKELFALMHREQSAHSSSDVIRGYLQVLVAKALTVYNLTATRGAASLAGSRILKTFIESYMNDFNVIRHGGEIKVRKVSEYADRLGISQNHLNDTVKSITGKSAGQLMREQIVKQASMCLRHSSKTVSEIAYLLGFEDPSYFARYYKKHTGKMPSELRAKTQ